MLSYLLCSNTTSNSPSLTSYPLLLLYQIYSIHTQGKKYLHLHLFSMQFCLTLELLEWFHVGILGLFCCHSYTAPAKYLKNKYSCKSISGCRCSLLDESLCFVVACLEKNCKTTESFGLKPVLRSGYGPRQLEEQ